MSDEACPCGCGSTLPDFSPRERFDAADVVEAQLDKAGLTVADLREQDRSLEVVAARRRVARYLSDHGWTLSRIGRYLRRDHSTIHNLLYGPGARS